MNEQPSSDEQLSEAVEWLIAASSDASPYEGQMLMRAAMAIPQQRQQIDRLGLRIRTLECERDAWRGSSDAYKAEAQSTSNCPTGETQEKIVTAVNYHARELARLTETWTPCLHGVDQRLARCGLCEWSRGKEAERPSSSDPSAALDMDAIERMTDVAREHDLLAEVVWSFGNARAGGSSIHEAIEIALSGWPR